MSINETGFAVKRINICAEFKYQDIICFLAQANIELTKAEFEYMFIPADSKICLSLVSHILYNSSFGMFNVLPMRASSL